jgi:C-terminal processing protease CtpA/Prc
MKRIWILSALLTFVAFTARAGDGMTCDHSTQECLDYMATKMKSSGYVGVELEGIEDAPGNLVKRVLEGGPAEAAGVKAGDVLLVINDVKLVDENMEKVREIWKTSAPGDRVVWTVARGTENVKCPITLGAMPADVLARYVGEHMLQHAQLELASKE